MRIVHWKTILRFVEVVIAVTALLHAQQPVPELEQPEVAFSLSASKGSYKVGEAIEVTYRIENKGSKAFYVNPEVRQLWGFDAGVIVTLYDRRGRRVPYQVVGHGPIPDYQRMNIAEHIRTNWLLLRPGTFYGATGRYHSAYAPKKGKYKLVATYVSNVLSVLTPSQIEALKELQHPVLAGIHHSNEVWIEIVD